ncbi:acyl CoA binding protein-domain-containing protein [Pilaira anomala]|nr:acyl CoA binding protein-domain-containing protein [Pilaira anomala]
MVNIPAHYSDRYISQRYNKALYIVQHLPNSSNVQPTKDQRLELYSYYKQVSQGNLKTPRPGIFDVVGRAKWDAWKKLEGMTELEAKHAYVEILLQVAMEAYKKPAGRAQAHQIIQSFAVMQPSGDSGDSSSEEDSSVGSSDAEEMAYLRQIERATPNTTRRPQPTARTWRNHPNNNNLAGSRASSRASSTGQLSMATAPTEFGRMSQQSSRSVDIRPNSVASSNYNRTNNLLRGKRVLYDEHFDESVNPWVLQSSSYNNRAAEQQDIYRSPISTSSSVTATQYNNSVTNERFTLGRSQDQHVLLGPATKRAIESIQKEIEALNERINGLRKEMLDRDGKKKLTKKNKPVSVPEDGWKWVIKAALKHASMNLLTTLVLFLVLYKSQSPIAKAVMAIIQKYWDKFKLYILISKILV